MPKFEYAAITTTGEEVRGVVDAFNVTAVTGRLFEQGMQVQRIRRRRSLLQLEITTEKVKPAELMHFSRQLAAFVRAGVPIVDAIQIVGEEAKDKTLRRVLGDMADALRRGDTFASAAAAHTKVFPPFYVSVLRSAELTGRLDHVLDQLSRYIERDLEARRKVKGALAYPAVLLVLALVVACILVVFVLPKFQTFFDSFHAKLPLPTRMLLATTHFLTSWWWALAGGAATVVATIALVIRSRGGRQLWSRLLLRVPAIGVVVRYAVVERFCRILAAMVQAGVTLPDALQLATEGAHNAAFAEPLRGAREAMLEGEGIAEPIARTKLFPSAVTQMMRVGEGTGTLDDQLESTASYYEKELEYKLKNLTMLFEPAAILIMGVIIGFVALALVSAMYGIFNQVNLK